MKKLDRYLEEIQLNEFDPLTIYTGMLASVFAITVAKIATAVYKRFLTKAGRACKGYTGNELVKCRNKFKKEALLKKVEVLNTYKSKCKSTKDPEKCLVALNKMIEKTKNAAGKIYV